MAKFKVGYRTRLKLQKAIQQVIRNEGLIDTRTLYNSVRISTVEGDLNRINITINAVYYYAFLDLGTRDIARFRITDQALESGLGREFLSDVIGEYMEWLIATYPILQVARINEPTVTYGYNLFGDPTGQYNGLYTP